MQIYIYCANEAPVAVILARYNTAKKFYKMFLWHTDTNKIEAGQWLTHKKIWANLCRLSDDGTRFQYFMAEFNPWNTYTVVSQPPYFTAIKIKKETGNGETDFVDSPATNPTMLKDPQILHGPDDLTNLKGKIMEFRDNILLIDNQCIINFNDYTFENIVSPSNYPTS